MYTNVSKPTGTPYTNTNTYLPSYDEPTIIYDDPNVFYDGFSDSVYANVTKPTGSSYTNIAKPT